MLIDGLSPRRTVSRSLILLIARVGTRSTNVEIQCLTLNLLEKVLSVVLKDNPSFGPSLAILSIWLSISTAKV